METHFHRLTSPTTDVIIKTQPFAEIIYWGPHLAHFSPRDCASLIRPVANGRLDTDSPVTLMAEQGHGLFGAPGLEGHRNGLDASPLFTTRDVTQDGQTLTLVSEDATAGLRLVSVLARSDSGVLKVRHGLTNLRAGAGRWIASPSRCRWRSARSRSWRFMAAGRANSSRTASR